MTRRGHPTNPSVERAPHPAEPNLRTGYHEPRPLHSPEPNLWITTPPVDNSPEVDLHKIIVAPAR
jgi:hypothetical protein